MFRHQLCENLILRLDLLLQIGDSLLLGGVVGTPLRLESSRPVLEELLLPTVEDRGLEFQFVAQFRDRHLLDQMPSQDGNLFFPRVVLALLLHAFSPLPYWENAFSISN